MNKETISGQEETIILDPIIIRYLATCHPFPDRPGIEACRGFRATYRSHQSPLTLPLKDFALPFPTFFRRVQQSGFNPFAYFEGHEEKSHNHSLYMFPKTPSFSSLPEDVQRSILNHLHFCAVKPVDLTQGVLWSFGGAIPNPVIDSNFFSTPVLGRYILVHGVGDIGHIAIRSITPDQFHQLTQGFARFSRHSNAFTQHGFDHNPVVLPASSPHSSE